MTTTPEYLPTINFANLLQQAPATATLEILDQDGNPQPVLAAFGAMNGGTDVEAPTGSCYLALSDCGVNGGWYGQAGTLADDPLRIVLSPAQPEGFPDGVANTYYPGAPVGYAGGPYTAGTLFTALGLNSVNGLISYPNTGDVPTNDGSPVALVQQVPSSAEGKLVPPTLVLVHGIYVDHERNRVLLARF